MVLVILLIGFFCALLFPVCVFLAYKFFYDSHTNRILASGIVPKRRWPAPWIIYVIVLVVTMAVFALLGSGFVLMVRVADEHGQAADYSDMPQMIDIHISEVIRYEMDGGRYELIDEGSDNGIDYSLYRYQTKDSICNYVIIAEFAVPGAGRNTVECGYNTETGGVRASEYYDSYQADPDVYCMIEIEDTMYSPGTIEMTVSAGDEISKLTLEI
ncbi:MAG: hypothetical protein IKE53_06890 [Clostridiales bacterium]|nr:hypothetical protein [Clostridiales bacterium]